MAVYESTAPVPVRSCPSEGVVPAEEVRRVIFEKRLSIRQVAKQFGVSIYAVYRWRREGLTYLHGLSRVTPEAWDAFALTGHANFQPQQEVIIGPGLTAAQPNRSVRLSIALPKGMAPLRGFAALPANELARMCGVKPSTARRWRKSGKAPAHIVTLLEFFHHGPLGMVSPAWDQWGIRNGKLFNSDGHEYTPGEVWVIPILHQRIAALELTIRQLDDDLARTREFRMANSISGSQPLLNAPRVRQ